MTEWFFTCLRISFFASVMILAVLLARPLLRKAPRNIICLLWLLVAVRLLVPFELKSPISLQPWQMTETVSLTDLTPQWIPVPPEESPVTDVQPEPQEPLSDMNPDSQKPVTVVQPQAPRNVDVKTIFAVIWISGGVSLLVYAAVSLAVLRHRVRDAVQCPDGIWESDRIADAFLLGYWKPRIYLPSGLPQRDRELIVAHERAHQSRGDQWWKLLGLLCLSIHWFNPLVWLSFGLVCRDIEAACDEKVIGKLDLSQRKEYSLALLNSGKRMSGLLSYPVAFGEVNLKHRIKSVLSYRKPGLWVTLGAVTLAAVIAVCFMTNPGSRNQDQNAGKADTQPEATVAPTYEATEPVTEPTEPTAALTEPVTEPTEPTAAPTEPETEPTAAPTEPVTTPTEADTEPTEAVTLPTEVITPPTEPVFTEPPTEPQPTQPPVTEPEGPAIVAEGRWGGNILWKITSDGVLTLWGNRHIEGAFHYPWIDHKNQVANIIIDEGITTIPSDAFRGMDRVTEVSIPSTVKLIESEAFRECTSLRSVTIPAMVTELEEGTFFGCTSLHSINFAPGSCLETIGVGAFYGTGLIEFHAPSGLKTIGNNAFLGCNSLQVLDLWEGNATIHQMAFKDCRALKHIKLGQGNRLSQYEYPWWFNVETAVLYSDFYELFSNRPKLHSVEIGGQMREVPFNAFKDCTALTNVTITAPITSVEQGAFKNCSSLKELELPDTVEEIWSSAFEGTGITKFTVPASVTKLYWGAFKDSALQEIRFLGDAPHFTEDNIFSGVTATVYYPADNITWTQEKLQNYGGNLTWVPVNG